MPGYDASSIATLRRGASRAAIPMVDRLLLVHHRGGPHADVGLPEASTVALLDAAVHVASPADSSNPRLMFPAAVESVWFAAEPSMRRVSSRYVGAPATAMSSSSTSPSRTRRHDMRRHSLTSVRSYGVWAGAGRIRDVSPVSCMTPAWSRMSAADILSELEIRPRAILARELGMPAAVAVGYDMPFPELGLDSMMAMTVLREAQRYWVSTCLRRCCGTTRPSHRWRRICRKCLHRRKSPGRTHRCDARLGEQCAGCVVRQCGIGSSP